MNVTIFLLERTVLINKLETLGHPIKGFLKVHIIHEGEKIEISDEKDIDYELLQGNKAAIELVKNGFNLERAEKSQEKFHVLIDRRSIARQLLEKKEVIPFLLKKKLDEEEELLRSLAKSEEQPSRITLWDLYRGGYSQIQEMINDTKIDNDEK